METWNSHSVADTLALGARFASRLRAGDVVALEGELGSGKTHFVKGVCAGLGFAGVVSSPTFALINAYDHLPPIYHVDLYRLESDAQVRALGLDEIFSSGGIVLIEWPDRAASLLPATCIRVRCAHGGAEGERTFVIGSGA